MADTHGIIVEDVKRQIAIDLRVYDMDGNPLGFVDQYDVDAGWMKVRRGLFVAKDLYIPFSKVMSIDPKEIYLLLPKDELMRDYGTPPPRVTVTEDIVKPGSVETMALTTEPSGYNGTPVVVDRVDVDEIKQHIAAGMRVYTDTNDDLGTIKRYDPVTGGMLVEKGLLSPHDLYIPVSMVQNVNQAEREVYLTVGKEDLERIQHSEPAKKFISECS